MSILTVIQCDRCGVVVRELKADGHTWVRLSGSGFMAGAFIAAGVHDFCSERCLMMWLTTKDSESKIKFDSCPPANPGESNLPDHAIGPQIKPVAMETKITQLQVRVLALEQSLKIIEARVFSMKPNQVMIPNEK